MPVVIVTQPCAMPISELTLVRARLRRLDWVERHAWWSRLGRMALAGDPRAAHIFASLGPKMCPDELLDGSCTGMVVSDSVVVLRDRSRKPWVQRTLHHYWLGPNVHRLMTARGWHRQHLRCTRDHRAGDKRSNARARGLTQWSLARAWMGLI